jgi:hypothetical protein
LDEAVLLWTCLSLAVALLTENQCGDPDRIDALAPRSALLQPVRPPFPLVTHLPARYANALSQLVRGSPVLIADL